MKEKIVEQREFNNIRLVREYVAEFDYQPYACNKAYRVVVVWKDLQEFQGQKKLFDYTRCFFYITNERKPSAAAIVNTANGRCNQENHIQQYKHGVPALTAPLDNLVSNGAYMVMAALAWSLKAWAALLLPALGHNKTQREKEKQQLLGMEFQTFCQAMINVPAQIIRSGRQFDIQIVVMERLAGSDFFRLRDQLQHPLRC